MDSSIRDPHSRDSDSPNRFDPSTSSPVDSLDSTCGQNLFYRIRRNSCGSSTVIGPPANAIPQNNTTSISDARDQSTTCATTRETSSESSDDEVILSVYTKSGILGAASYSLDNPIIYVVNDVADTRAFGFKTLESILIQVQPTQIVTMEGMPATFIEMLKLWVTDENDSRSTRAKLHLLPPVEFRNNNCMRRVLALRLPSKPKDWSDECHVQFLRTVLDFNAYCMIQALGGLLKFIDKNLSFFTGGNDQNPYEAIKTMYLEDVVAIDQDTYKALGIFPTKKQSFSNWATQKSNKPSVFGLLDRCRSALGSKFMESIFLKPTKDLSVIAERQEVIAFFMDLRNDEVTRNLQLTISQVRRVSSLIPKLRGLQANTLMWKNLHTTLQNVLHIAELCGCFERISFFSKIRSLVKKSDLPTLTRVIGKMVDFDAPEGQHKFVVMPGVDEALDRMKATHASLPDILNKMAEYEIEDLPDFIPECVVTYYPEIGFLLAVHEWKNSMTKREMQLPGYDYQFMSNGVIHYKSKRCKELDAALGDPIVQIADVQLSMMVRLVDYVQRHVETIIDVVNMVAELDCLISLATVAREHNYVRPEMSKEHKIDIIQGRHLLEEALTSSFVPNDVKSDENLGLVKIITGANNSGKTVYLKQSALIVFLAHLGSFVPAQKATIQIMDRMRTLVRSDESTGHQTSAYLNDVRQISKIVTTASAATFIVIDEFGRNTTASEGKAIFVACLNHLLRRGPTGCPHVMCTTHFHGIRRMLVDSPLVVEQRMDQMITNDGEITNLYRIVDGSAANSIPIQAAILAELPQSIINRAKELMSANAEARVLDSSHYVERGEEVMAALLEAPLDTEEDLKAIVQYFGDRCLL